MVRNRYDRMTPAELSESLDLLHLTAGQFARLVGAQRRRVLQWLEGTEDIPHHIFVMAETWSTSRDALALAREIADDMIVEQELDVEATVPPDTS